MNHEGVDAHGKDDRGEDNECNYKNTVIQGTHSPFVNMAAGTCESETQQSSCISRSIGELVSPGATLDMEAWELYLVEAHAATYDTMTQNSDFLVWLEDQDFDISAMMQLLPIIESQVLIEDGKVSGFAEFTYGSCENQVLETVPGAPTLYGEDGNLQEVLHHFPQRDNTSSRPGFGCCTCKGAIANQFENKTVPANATDDERYPFRRASSRKVVYEEGVSYSANASELANLHMCPFASLPFSTDGHLLTSQDALILDAAALNTDMLYVIELVNEVRDFAATDPPQDATTGRRLLSGLFPLGEASAGTVRQENSGRGYAQSSGGAFVVEGPETNVDPADTTTADKVWSIVVGFVYWFFLIAFMFPTLQLRKLDLIQRQAITCGLWLPLIAVVVLTTIFIEHDVVIVPTLLAWGLWYFLRWDHHHKSESKSFSGSDGWRGWLPTWELKTYDNDKAGLFEITTWVFIHFLTSALYVGLMIVLDGPSPKDDWVRVLSGGVSLFPLAVFLYRVIDLLGDSSVGQKRVTNTSTDLEFNRNNAFKVRISEPAETNTPLFVQKKFRVA